MFDRLMSRSGLSLDRLRALVEVGAAGSIVRAAGSDPVRQSQYSRQIKELEDYFQARLVERQGRGIALTSQGKELARISRFFLLGLSNFQRGCSQEAQHYRIGCGITFSNLRLMSVLSNPDWADSGIRFDVDVVSDEDIERRLHDLTLDFGVVSATAFSRPLQLTRLGSWRLSLFVPRRLHADAASALRPFAEGRMPLVMARGEPALDREPFLSYPATVNCSSFLDARSALAAGNLATVLPDFMELGALEDSLLKLCVPEVEAIEFTSSLAWNPRLLRLNPRAIQVRDRLSGALAFAE